MNFCSDIHHTKVMGTSTTKMPNGVLQQLPLLWIGAIVLNLVLLNPDIPYFANIVDPDHWPDLDLHCLSLRI